MEIPHKVEFLRYWATDNVYATLNGGGYTFVTEEATKRALPTDTRFWADLFGNNSDWGLAVYEQEGASIKLPTFARKFLPYKVAAHPAIEYSSF